MYIKLGILYTLYFAGCVWSALIRLPSLVIALVLCFCVERTEAMLDAIEQAIYKERKGAQ